MHTSRVFLFLKIALILWLIINPGSLSANQCSPLFEEAIQASRKADFVEALSIWDQLFEVCPQYVFGSNTQANELLTLKNFQEEISDQINSTDFLSDSLKSHLDHGLAAETLKLWGDAETDFNLILKSNPDNAFALYNLGSIRTSQEHWTEALELFNRASLAQSDFLLALSNKALTIYQLGKLDEAESELRAIVLKYPMFALLCTN